MAYVTTSAKKGIVAFDINNNWVKAHFISGKPYGINNDHIVTDEEGNQFRLDEGPYQTLTMSVNDCGPSVSHFKPALFNEGELKVNQLTDKTILKSQHKVQILLGEVQTKVGHYTITSKAFFELCNMLVKEVYELSVEDDTPLTFNNQKGLLNHLADEKGEDLTELFKMPSWDIKLPMPEYKMPSFLNISDKRGAILLGLHKIKQGFSNTIVYVVASKSTRLETTLFGLAISEVYQLLEDHTELEAILNNDHSVSVNTLGYL